MLGQRVPIIVYDRMKTEMQEVKMCAWSLHAGCRSECPLCNYGHGWPAMTAHLLASQQESGAPGERQTGAKYKSNVDIKKLNK